MVCVLSAVKPLVNSGRAGKSNSSHTKGKCLFATAGDPRPSAYGQAVGTDESGSEELTERGVEGLWIFKVAQMSGAWY